MTFNAKKGKRFQGSSRLYYTKHRFFDEDDDTYIDDLIGILPKLFDRELKPREQYDHL